MRPFSSPFLTSLSASLGLALCITAGCDLLDPEVSVPKEARVRVSGTSPVSLELVTSTEFTYAPGPGGDPDVVFLESDTLWVDLPTVHDRTYPVRPNLGFAVRLTNPDTATALVNVQVWLDGSLKYDLEDYPLKDSFVEFSRVYRTGGE